jgi:hypothetical protein
MRAPPKINKLLVSEGFGFAYGSYWRPRSNLELETEICLSKFREKWVYRVNVFYPHSDGAIGIAPMELCGYHSDGSQDPECLPFALDNPQDWSNVSLRIFRNIDHLANTELMIQVLKYMMGEINKLDQIALQAMPWLTQLEANQIRMSPSRLLSACTYLNLSGRFDEAGEYLDRYLDKLPSEKGRTVVLKIADDIRRGRVLIPSDYVKRAIDCGAKLPPSWQKLAAEYGLV